MLFFCGDRVIDYGFIENFVLDLEKNYGVIIKGIGYDRYNAISSVNKWNNEGYERAIERVRYTSVLDPENY